MLLDIMLRPRILKKNSFAGEIFSRNICSCPNLRTNKYFNISARNKYRTYFQSVSLDQMVLMILLGRILPKSIIIASQPSMLLYCS